MTRLGLALHACGRFCAIGEGTGGGVSLRSILPPLLK